MTLSIVAKAHFFGRFPVDGHPGATPASRRSCKARRSPLLINPTPPTREVDEKAGRFHLAERFVVEHILRFVRERQMTGDKVCLTQQRFQSHQPGGAIPRPPCYPDAHKRRAR